MTTRVSSGVGVVTLAFCLVASCVAKNAPPTPAAPVAPSTLYPLRAGNAWSYDVDTGDARTTLAITKVESFDGRVAVIRTGEALTRYEVLPEGIRLQSEEAWLLRAPLRAGATWPARGGRTGRLLSLQAVVETPAGVFEGCLEVYEGGGELDLEVRTIYCPNVGPVFVASTMRSKVSERTLTVSARLRGFQVTDLLAPDR